MDETLITYDVAHVHYRDMYGRLLWVEPIKEEHRLFEVGEIFTLDYVKYKINRFAIVDNTIHLNISVIKEDVNITEPHL